MHEKPILSDMKVHFERVIEERRTHLAEQIADGVAADYANYKWMAGKRAGLKDALEIINEALSRYEYDADSS